MMQGRIIFLLEEPSMKVLLGELLPRLFPGWVEGQHFLCVPHEGKSDLDKSIPVKLKAWQEKDACFVIVRDNDNANCSKVKVRLLEMCEKAGRPDTLVRLVCQELESWYLGDLQALEQAFECSVNGSKNRKRFVCPDAWQKPSDEVRRLIPSFQKTGGARSIAKHLNLAIQKNRSRSFQVFIEGVQNLAKKMGYVIATSNTNTNCDGSTQ
jgi:hypothetical protein